MAARSREKYITDEDGKKSVYRRGEGLGTGPVGGTLYADAMRTRSKKGKVSHAKKKRC